MKGQVEYVLVNRSVSDTAIVETYRPVLTPDEYKRRLKRVQEAAKALLEEKYWPKTKESYI